MSDYKEILLPHLKDVEGSSDDVYHDSVGVPTAGHGFNLDDKENQAIFKLHGVDPTEVRQGTRKIASEEADAINGSILDRKERLIRDKVGSEFFDTLSPNKKAAIMSLGYQSLNNIGPNLMQHLSSDDDVAAMKEMILNTNAKNDPGIQSRRLKEAALFNPDPVTFSSAFKVMSDDEKKKVLDTLNKTQNENTKKELLNKYSPYLSYTPQPANFSRLLGK